MYTNVCPTTNTNIVVTSFFKMLGNIKHYHHIVIRLKLGEDKRLLKGS
jgi:hypothetical protein